MVTEDIVCLLDRTDVVKEHMQEPAMIDPPGAGTGITATNMFFTLHNFDKPNVHSMDDGFGMVKIDPRHTTDSNKEVQNQIRNTLTNNYSALMNQLATEKVTAFQ